MTKLFLAAGLVAAMGCSNKPGAASTGSGSGSAAAVAATPVAAPAGPITIDPELAKRVKAIVASCQIELAAGPGSKNSVSDCKHDEDDAILDYIKDHKDTATGALESLAEIAMTDGAKDPKVRVAVVETWPALTDHAFEKTASTPAAADRIIKLYATVGPSSVHWSYAAHVPLLAGKHAELAATLATLGEDREWIRTSTYEEFLQYGGIAALADLQAVVTAAKTPKDQEAALAAVGIAVHAGALTGADEAKACDWVKSVVAAPALDDHALAGGLDSLGRCGGAYIDAGLAVIDANIQAKLLGVVTADKLLHMCWTDDADGPDGTNPVNGSTAQCAKAFALLEAGATAKAQQPGALETASATAEQLGKNSPELAPRAKALVAKLAPK